MLFAGDNEFEVLAPYSEIVNNLWIGSLPPNGLLDPKFFGVISVTQQGRHITCPNQVYYRQPFSDDAFIPPNIERIASVAREFAEMGPTLVHCAAGLNRSALVVALALIQDGMKPRDAVDLVRYKRSRDALHNETFERYLLEWKPKRELEWPEA